MSRVRRAGPEPDNFLPLPRDTFDVLVSLADRDRHGYAILQDIAERTDGRIRLSPSTLYAVIKRLLESALIEELSERPDPAHQEHVCRALRDRALKPAALTLLVLAIAGCEAGRHTLKYFRRDDREFIVYCFRELSDAQLLAMHFDGEMMTPRTRPPSYPKVMRRAK
jgi:hypothetical protein